MGQCIHCPARWKHRRNDITIPCDLPERRYVVDPDPKVGHVVASNEKPEGSQPGLSIGSGCRVAFFCSSTRGKGKDIGGVKKHHVLEFQLMCASIFSGRPTGALFGESTAK